MGSIRTIEDARESGRAARLSGKAREECPLKKYPVRALRVAWLDGWDKAVSTPRPEVKIAEVEEVSTREVFWPEGKVLPQSYRRPAPVPCVACKIVLLATQAQAVVVRATANGMAYMWCRGCNHKFKMRIEDLP